MPPPTDTPSRRLFWAGVAVLSVGGRLLALWLLSGRILGGDNAIYVALAQNLAHGHGLVVDDPNVLNGMRATYPPLYPLILAGVGLVAPLTFATIAAINTAIDTACAWLLLRLGREITSPPAATAAAALYLLWPSSLAAAPTAHKEGLIALLTMGLVTVLVRLARQPGLVPAIGYGILSALLALTQPGLAPLPALLALAAIAAFGSGRRWLAAMGIAAVAALVAMTPWWIRNAILFGRFVPLTAAGGYGLWVGAAPQGNGLWVQPPSRFLRGDEFQMAAAMGREAWRIIAADPGRYLMHCLQKLIRAYVREDWSANPLYRALPEAHEGVGLAVAFVSRAAQLTALAGAGAFVVRGSNRLLARLILAGIAQTVLFGMWFEFSERHRFFLTPLLILAACAAFGEWRERRKAPQT